MKVYATLKHNELQPDLMDFLLKNEITSYRFNMSKCGNEEELEQLIDRINSVKALSDKIEIMIDLPYPRMKYRVRIVNTGKISIQAGKRFFIYMPECKNILENGAIVFCHSVNLSSLHIGDWIYYDNGQCVFKICNIFNNGAIEIVSSADVEISEYDSISFVKWIENSQYMFLDRIIDKIAPFEVALSGVENALEVAQLEKYRQTHGVRIISKIEDEIGIKNAIEIGKISDGIILARGDLGIYGKFENMFIYEKSLSEICNRIGKDYYIATDILASIKDKYIPSRGDLIDLAYAISLNPYALILNTSTFKSIYRDHAMEIIRKTQHALKNHV